MSLVFLAHSVLRVLSERLFFGVLTFVLSLTLCTADFLFLSFSAPCWTVTVCNHHLRLSQQKVLYCFLVSFSHGEYQVLCRLYASYVHMMYCDALLRCDRLMECGLVLVLRAHNLCIYNYLLNKVYFERIYERTQKNPQRMGTSDTYVSLLIVQKGITHHNIT